MIKNKMLPLTLLPTIIYVIFLITMYLTTSINHIAPLPLTICLLLLLIGGICLAHKDFLLNILGIILMLLFNIIMFFRMINIPDSFDFAPMILVTIIAVTAFFKDYIDNNISNLYY